MIPFGNIAPGEIISQHSDWLYFGLVMVFFISMAGVALRKHFDRPYVKPLIVTVGLILTITVFNNRQVLAAVVNGWGTLGSIMLIAMVVIIPFGLAKGFGLKSGRAFWIAYLIGYSIAWANYPQFFEVMGRRGLGLINFILFVLFLVSLWGALRFRLKQKWAPEADYRNNIHGTRMPSPDNEESDHNLNTNKMEERAVSRDLLPANMKEFKTIDQIANLLRNIEKIVREHGQSLTGEDRRQIANQLQKAMGQERLFRQKLYRAKNQMDKMRFIGAKELNQLKVRAQNADGPTRKLLLMELARNTEKLHLEQAIKKADAQLSQGIQSFEKELRFAMQGLQANANTRLINANLQKASEAFKANQETILTIENIQKRLLRVIREEHQLIKVEERAA